MGQGTPANISHWSKAWRSKAWRSKTWWPKARAPLFVATVFGVAALAQVSANAANDRSIDIYNIHTKESLSVTYKRDGRFIPSAMSQINTLMRDWRVDKTITIDPALIDLIWELRRDLGSTKPARLISGHRSERTNNMLRRRRGGQAKRSLHIVGKAMDVYFPGVPLKKLRNAALVKQTGGVGYYPRSGTPFVHIDTGRFRHWPRIPEQQLAAILKGSPAPRIRVASKQPKTARKAPLVLASVAAQQPTPLAPPPATKPVQRRWGESWLTPTRRVSPQPRRKPQATTVVAQNGSAELPLGVVTAYARPDRAGANSALTAMIEGTPTALPDLLANPGLMRELSDQAPGSQIQMPTALGAPKPMAPPAAAPIVTASLAPDLAPPNRPSLVATQAPALATPRQPASGRIFATSPFAQPFQQRFDAAPRVISGMIGKPASTHTKIFKGQLFATKVLYTFSIADQPGYLVASDVRVALAPPEDDTPVLVALAKRAYAWLTGG